MDPRHGKLIDGINVDSPILFLVCLSDMLCLIVQPLEPQAARLPSTVAYANGASFSFLLNRTTAFFLYGAMRADHDSFAVTIKRSPDNTIIRYLQLNHTSHWFDLKALLYFETGLDIQSVYEVTFENVGTRAFSVRYIEIIQVEATDVPLLTPGVSSLLSSQDSILTVFGFLQDGHLENYLLFPSPESWCVLNLVSETFSSLLLCRLVHLWGLPFLLPASFFT